MTCGLWGSGGRISAGGDYVCCLCIKSLVSDNVKNEGNKNHSPKQTNCIKIINIYFNCDETQTKTC